jgi:hypothetical protein
MATLRSLLVNHITETHDARTVNGKLTGPNLLEALQERQHQHAGVQACTAASCSSTRHHSVQSFIKQHSHPYYCFTITHAAPAVHPNLRIA